MNLSLQGIGISEMVLKGVWGSSRCVGMEKGLWRWNAWSLQIRLMQLGWTWVRLAQTQSVSRHAWVINCSCTAFISININGKATRCLVWYGELMDILVDTNERRDLNVCVDATQLGSLLCYLEFVFLNFHYFTFWILDSPFACLLLIYFFLFFFQQLTLGSPKVFLATRGSWLLLYHLLLCHCFWYPSQPIYV